METKKRSKLSMVAMILGIIAIIFALSALFGMDESTNDAEAVGMAIGTAIIMPSLISLIVAVILNIIGYFTVNRSLTLISAIFYVVSLILMPLWGFLGIPSMILQFIAFAKLKNPETKVVYIEKSNQSDND